MNTPSSDESQIAQHARAEFDSLVDALLRVGVKVLVHEDELELPDCVFPNNWVSIHEPAAGSTIILTYPMCNQLRRAERSGTVLERLLSAVGDVDHIDLSALEDDGEILEGTGSLVLDRIAGVAFACLSPRTTRRALEAWCDETGYVPVLFEALDDQGGRIYHTNVMMSVGSKIAVVCLDSVSGTNDQDRILSILDNSSRRILNISREQMNNFCGNILELESTDGQTVFAMSSRAWNSFTELQQSSFQEAGQVVHVAIPTIEDVGGGSVRCMIAECGRASI